MIDWKRAGGCLLIIAACLAIDAAAVAVMFKMLLALEAFKLLGLTPLEIFQASRSISLGVAAKAKAESGRREL